MKKRILQLCVVLVLVSMPAVVWGVRPADFGKQWIRSHPFAIMGLSQRDWVLDAEEYAGAGFNTFLAWKRPDEQLSIISQAGIPWHFHVSEPNFSSSLSFTSVAMAFSL